MNEPGIESDKPPIWRRHGTIVATTTLAVTVLAASCGGSDGEATAETASSGEGAELYQANCASCHGADLGGTDKGPSHLSIVYEPNHHDDDAFRAAIANGAQQHHWAFGNMAPIAGLSDDQVDEIIAFVRAEQERQGFDQ